MPLTPIPEILNELRAGRMVILTDDENRENEGDLILPAEFVTPEAITFMLSVARGYMCLSLTAADCDRLDLHPQGMVNTSARGTPFTVSIDGHPKHGFTTGVSARERAKSIKMAIDPASRPDDFVRPGHINPLRSRDGGVLVRTGQTEGSVDLCRLAGLYPAAIIIEIMRDDGEMARMPDLEELAAKHNIKICTVAQIIEHRLERETLVQRIEPVGGTPIETEFGAFNLIAMRAQVDPLPHIALCVGGVGALDGHGRVIESDEPTLVRMHRRHLLGDVFHDVRSSPEGATAQTLHESMRMIQAAGRGAIVYLRPEGLPGGETEHAASLEQRLQTIVKHDVAHDSSSRPAVSGVFSGVPSMRDYGIGVQILRQLGLRNIELISNHKRGLPGLDAFGLRISRYVRPQI